MLLNAFHSSEPAAEKQLNPLGALALTDSLSLGYTVSQELLQIIEISEIMECYRAQGSCLRLFIIPVDVR